MDWIDIRDENLGRSQLVHSIYIQNVRSMSLLVQELVKGICIPISSNFLDFARFDITS